MDPEAAMELARKGVTLLLLEVPQHTVLGVDTQVAMQRVIYRAPLVISATSTGSVVEIGIVVSNPNCLLGLGFLWEQFDFAQHVK